MLKLKYIITTLCMLLAFTLSSVAQQRNFEAIESEKIAYITQELKLTPKEAQRFFPLYNRYNEEIWEIKRAKKRQNQDIISFDAKEVETKKKYREEFQEAERNDDAFKFKQYEQATFGLVRTFARSTTSSSAR